MLRDVGALRDCVARWRSAQPGARIGVVPTMGALHEGHLALVRAALAGAERVIVTLFVNPRQFNNPDDLARYPRTEGADAAKLGALGESERLVLYVPDVDVMYPPGFATTVSVAGVSEGLCGAFRPGHFDGVATVVAKLFGQTGADLAWFGEKDFQQLQVIRRMARDLDLPVAVIGHATIREADGLAMSSRNQRLSAAGRLAAPGLARALFAAADRLATGEAAASVLAGTATAIVAAGFERVEYLELRSEDDLAPLDAPTRPARLLVAAWLDGVRLIDNVRVIPTPTTPRDLRS